MNKLSKLMANRIMVAIGLSMVAALMVCAIAVAATALVTKSLPASGTITVTTPPPVATNPTYDLAFYSDAGATSPLTALDFTGSVVSGSSYSKTITVYVKNTGTDGTNGGAAATIASLDASSTDLQSGWAISGSLTQTLNVGDVGALDVTLSSNSALTTTTTLTAFTVDVAAN